MVDARDNTMTPDLFWFRPMRPYVQQGGGSTVLSCTGVPVVGGTSLSERSEAPKSLDVLEAIEVNANIGR